MAAATRLNNCVVIITGANTGIGLETALELSRRGAEIIIGCRDEIRGQKAVKLIAETSEKPDKVSFEKIDLASLSSIRDFVKRFNETHERLDVLINNAGIALSGPRQTTVDGFEMHFGVNHLGHFLLTNLLLDRLKESTPSRIVTVSSSVHRNGKIHWDDINLVNNFSGWSAYSHSKLANILFTRELARQLEGSGVTAVCLHPGVVSTEFFRNANFFMKLVVRVSTFFSIMKTPKEGAQTTIHCVVSPEVPSQSGGYFADCALAKPAPAALDDEAAKRLWTLSTEMVDMK